MKKPDKDDLKLVAMLDPRIRAAVGYLDSKLSLERREIRDYIQLLKPAKNQKGHSTYVSQDVHDSVTAMHANILETFCGNRRLVKFTPETAQEVQTTHIQTEYCAHVFYNQNDGFFVASDWIYDGLTSRLGCIKAWWDKKIVDRDLASDELYSWDEIEALQMGAAENVKEIKAEDQGDGTFTVTVVEEQDQSQVRIENVPPEEILIAKKARNHADARRRGIFHRTKKTEHQVRELLEDADWDKKDIDDAVGHIDEDNWITDIEDVERFSAVDGGEYDPDPEHENLTGGRLIWLYECYIEAKIGEDKRPALWKILKCGNVILAKEKVLRDPFIFFVPLREPHQFWGDNFASRVKQTQNTKTALIRAIVDHTLITTNPRFTLLAGGVARPAELFENRLGGGVTITKPDAIQPLVAQPLNPFVFQAHQQIDADNEDTTGVSRLSQGLNKDAVSKQNSAAMVEQLTSNSQIRQKIVARNFAAAMVELFILVSDLCWENESQERIIEVAGEYVPVDFTRWRRRSGMSIDVNLGYGEADREADKMLMIHQLLSSDPETKPQYSLPQKYKMISKVLELKGIPDVANYFAPPEKATPPQPDPLQQAEVQLKQAEAQAKMQKVQLDQQKVQMEAQLDQMKLKLETMKVQEELRLKSEELQLKREGQILDAEIAMREMAIVEKQAASENMTAIASPNS